MTPVEAALAAYDELEQERVALSELFEKAGSGEISYEEPDELSIDLAYKASDLLDQLVAALREEPTPGSAEPPPPGFQVPAYRIGASAAPEGEPEDEPDDWACQQVGYHLRTGRHVKGECRGEQEDERR